MRRRAEKSHGSEKAVRGREKNRDEMEWKRDVTIGEGNATRGNAEEPHRNAVRRDGTGSQRVAGASNGNATALNGNEARDGDGARYVVGYQYRRPRRTWREKIREIIKILKDS